MTFLSVICVNALGWARFRLAVNMPGMADREKKSRADRADLNALEADVAFFDARLSFAAEEPETAYQKAQKKTYQTLGSVMSDTLEKLKAKPQDR